MRGHWRPAPQPDRPAWRFRRPRRRRVLPGAALGLALLPAASGLVLAAAPPLAAPAPPGRIPAVRIAPRTPGAPAAAALPPAAKPGPAPLPIPAQPPPIPAPPPHPRAAALAGTRLGPVWLIYRQAAATAGVPPWLLAADGYWESAWDPRARRANANGSVDRGIAQINSVAHPGVSPAEAYNPAFAIPYQARLLAADRHWCGGWANALSCYKSGKPLAEVPPAARAATAAYVADVARTAAALAAVWRNPPALAATVRALQAP